MTRRLFWLVLSTDFVSGHIRQVRSVTESGNFHINCTSVNPFQCQSSANNAVSFSKLDVEQNAEVSTIPPITFSEFPINTAVSNQYSDKGVVFGNGAFITGDGANPTSPVLSGTPRFSGPIQVQFVVPGTSDPSIVASFSLDAGYFDAIGSTRLIIYDQQNRIIDQKTNTRLGIENFTVSGGGISKFTMEIFENEPAGFAIDNLVSLPAQSSLIFLESGSLITGVPIWGFNKNIPIPGFDHVGLHIDDVVYESHPGYPTGTYRGSDPDTPTKDITNRPGVQNQFTRLLFLHDSTTASSPTRTSSEIPLPRVTAEKMRTAIQSKLGAGFLFPNYDDIGKSFSNEQQKGAGGAYTCVGLVERAAEEANINDGQGFVPNHLESVNTVFGKFPLLSPELLHFCARQPKACFNSSTVFGFVDPVDYMVTDPLGRRLGFTNQSGMINEIPGAFLTPDGALEQFVIPAAVPGIWSMEYNGLGEKVRGVLTFSNQTATLQLNEFDGFLQNNGTVLKQIAVPVVPGIRGDVNVDGVLDILDVELVQSAIGRFTEGLYDSYDLTGDGKVKQDDVDTLLRLINVLNTATFSPTPSPTAAPKTCADQEGQPLRRLFCLARSFFRNLFGSLLG